MVEDLPQLLVDIGLLVVEDRVELHITELMELVVQEVEELDIIVQVIGISPFRYKENKALVEEEEDIIYHLHILSIVEMQTVVPVLSSSHILHNYLTTIPKGIRIPLLGLKRPAITIQSPNEDSSKT
jgi:hypothetical protein